jgi:BA14K-like protein
MPISAFGLAMPSDGVNWEQPYGSGSSHMAVSYHGSFGDRPRSGGGAVLAFLIVIGVTLVAFHVTAAGVFYEPPTVRIHAGSRLAAPPQILTDHPQIDETAKMSIAKPESQATSPACNYKACSQHYRSFDASDCSYQPYDGPRRQCRR